MPSDQSSWLIAAPNDGDAEGLCQELAGKFETQKALPRSNLAEFKIPELKTGTLDILITLSEELPKHDSNFTSTVGKIVDTLRNLLNNDSSRLAQHILVDEKSCDEYLLDGWKWNSGKYNPGRSLREIVDGLVKEMTSLDNVMKAKLTSYNLAKGALTQMQRKKTGNLSVRSLVDIVKREHVIPESEYMESVFVAVPKSAVKQWNASYERLAAMIVPRSSKLIEADDEYSLFSVVIFTKVRQEFATKCRENKYIIREFDFNEEEIEKQREELQMADLSEKELWTELLRLARTNFSEAFQVLVHLKIVRLFVESVLRYGLPANYVGLVIKPEPKTTKRTLDVLASHFAYLASKSRSRDNKKSSGMDDEYVGEYQTLMEQEIFDYVLFEVPWVVAMQLLYTPKEASASPDAIFVDSTWFMPNLTPPRSGYEEWKRRRIPGARYIDLDKVASPHPLGLKHMMPSGEVLAKACAGRTDERMSPSYDTHGVFSSPRALFMFKVGPCFGHDNAGILDGGLPRWEAQGFPIETTDPGEVQPRTYAVPKLDESAIRSYEQIVENAKLDPAQSAAELVLDARSYGRFTGRDPEPRPGLSSGHMPHARSLPFNTLLQKNGDTTYATVLPHDELKETFDKAVGEARGHHVVASCGSGMTAATIWLAGQLLGTPVSIYDESWTGYAMRPESVIVKDNA
ncbi:Vacuolar H+-ATPase V1 sector subunit C [Ceratobasidium theobromae]|uniref:V-type proton ATPase subunit C n=1 Tax=Ceratobasidium theobromae TaxID=1582974 RepID=A0A5N5QN52_9AGAM|nr:Vacuolar H+-ATPase V1 sector subunit C [Ceratobasidium theobromae]